MAECEPLTAFAGVGLRPGIVLGGISVPSNTERNTVLEVAREHLNGRLPNHEKHPRDDHRHPPAKTFVSATSEEHARQERGANTLTPRHAHFGR